MKYKVALKSQHAFGKIIREFRIKKFGYYKMFGEEFYDWSERFTFCENCGRQITHCQICLYCGFDREPLLRRQTAHFSEEFKILKTGVNKILLDTFTPFSHHYAFKQMCNTFVFVREENIEGIYFGFGDRPGTLHRFNLRYNEIKWVNACEGMLLICPKTEENLYFVLAVDSETKAQELINMKIKENKTGNMQAVITDTRA